MAKRWLVHSYCPVDRYYCLMPVEYEAVEEGDVVKEYRKSRMVCRHALSGECEEQAECSFFADAPEVLGKDENWYEG